MLFQPHSCRHCLLLLQLQLEQLLLRCGISSTGSCSLRLQLLLLLLVLQQLQLHYQAVLVCLQLQHLLNVILELQAATGNDTCGQSCRSTDGSSSTAAQ